VVPAKLRSNSHWMNLWVLGINTVGCNKSHEIALPRIPVASSFTLAFPSLIAKNIAIQNGYLRASISLLFSLSFFLTLSISFPRKENREGEHSNVDPSLYTGGWTTLSALNHRNVPVFKTPECRAGNLSFLFHFFSSSRCIGLEASPNIVLLIKNGKRHSIN